MNLEIKNIPSRRGRPKGQKNSTVASPEARANYSAARRAVWAKSAEARARKKVIQADLRLLTKVIRHEAAKIHQREASRVSSLAAWNARGKYKRRRKSLENAFRDALRRAEKLRAQRLQSLHKAALRLPTLHAQAVQTKLIRKLRRYFEKAFHVGSKSKRARELIGCTIVELRLHLEKQFKPDMTWDNHNYHGWHIDHIKPLASFDLSDPTQQQQAFHYSNLQPLWKDENFAKGKKLLVTKPDLC